MSLREYMASELDLEQREERARQRSRDGAQAAPRSMRPPPRRENSPRRDRPDVHALLRDAAYNADDDGAGRSSFTLQRGDPRRAGVGGPGAAGGGTGVSDQYVVLDSYSKVRTSDPSRGIFEWNLMVQGVTGDQVIGVRDSLENVIEAQMGSFSVPVLPDVAYALAPGGPGAFALVQNNTSAPAAPPTLVPNGAGAAGAAPAGQYPPAALPAGAATLAPWLNNPLSQTPFGNRVTVQIREAGLQSYSDRDGARHHFDFSLSWLGATTGARPDQLQAVPNIGEQWDKYTFTEPIRSLGTLSLVFRNPDAALRFAEDVFYDAEAVASAAGPRYLQLNLPRTAASPTHGLSAGDRIHVRGFSSAYPQLNAYVNRADGHAINGDPAAPAAPGVPIPSAANAVWLDPSPELSTLVPAPAAGAFLSSCEVYVAKRRLWIPMRFRRLVPRTTNSIQA